MNWIMAGCLICGLLFARVHPSTCESPTLAAGIDVAIIGQALGMTTKTLWER